MLLLLVIMMRSVAAMFASLSVLLPLFPFFLLILPPYPSFTNSQSLRNWMVVAAGTSRSELQLELQSV